MLKAILGATFALALSVATQAQTLYKGYDYDTPRGKIAAMTGVYECDLQVLCLDDQSFQGQPVGVGFVFVAEKLRTVLLDLTDSEDPYSAILLPLIKSPDWRLLIIGNPTNGTSLDIIHQARSGDTAPVQPFESGALAGGAVTYTMVEYTNATKALIDAAPNATALIAKLPEDTRFIDFVLNDPEETWYVMFYLAVKAMHSGAELESF